MWVNPCHVMGCNTLHLCLGGWWGIEHTDRGMRVVTWLGSSGGCSAVAVGCLEMGE